MERLGEQEGLARVVWRRSPSACWARASSSPIDFDQVGIFVPGFLREVSGDVALPARPDADAGFPVAAACRTARYMGLNLAGMIVGNLVERRSELADDVVLAFSRIGTVIGVLVHGRVLGASGLVAGLAGACSP